MKITYINFIIKLLLSIIIGIACYFGYNKNIIEINEGTLIGIIGFLTTLSILGLFWQDED